MDTGYLKRVGLYILSALVSLGIVFYFGYHIWHSFTREVETEPVREITAEQTVKCDGFIFRTEETIAKGSGGSAVASVPDGTKMKVGGEVSRIYSVSSPETVAKISDIDEKINLIESYTKDGSVSLKNTEQIDSEIYSALSSMRGAADNGNLGDALQYKSKMMAAANKRSILTGAASDVTAELSALKNEKESMKSALGSCLDTVTAPVSGYYYSQCDGYESVFKAHDLEEITYDSLSTLLSSPEGAKGTSGKIVTESNWYLVCRVGREYADTYTEGSGCSVKFALYDKTMDMTVYRILEGRDDIIIILKTNVIPTGFDFSRVQTVELITSVHTGFRIPVTAVRMIDDTTGVYVLEGPTVRFRRVSIIFRSDNSYIVETDPTADMTDEEKEEDAKKAPWLKLHDSLIVEGKGLYDGKVIGN